MKNLKVFVERLKTKWFPKEEDKLWKQWVDYKPREKRDLVELLSSDVKDSFKKRALFLLLVPSEEFSPIYWKEEVGKFYHGPDFLKGLSSDLLSYVADLITEFCVALRPLHDPETKYAVEGGPGITVYVPVQDKYHEALYFYNKCIMTLLAIASRELGARVFPLFSLRDISTWESMEDMSGYSPFQRLLYDQDINESWKKIADIAMRDIVLGELAGKTKPRERWEDAWQWYANIINSQLFGGKPSYPLNLLADQIQFLLLHRRTNKKLINAYNVIRVFKLFSNEGYKHLRHQVSRFVVLECRERHESFFVYDEETLQAANQMLTEFENSDPELAKKVRWLIKKAEKRDAENATEEAKEKKAETNILAQMK